MKSVNKIRVLATLAIVMACASPSYAADYVTPKTSGPGRYYDLRPGDAFVSLDGRFRMLYQQDGNLVLYQGSEALWDSDTYQGGKHKQKDYGYAPGYARGCYGLVCGSD